MASSEAESKSWWQIVKNCSGTELDRRNQFRFTAWIFAWAVSYVVAHKILKSDSDLATQLVWFLVAAPNLVAVAAVFAYLRFLRMADELLRKIQLEGLAFGFAAGIIFINGYQLLEAAGVRELQTDHIIIVMLFGWSIGQFVGMWRYR
jgi:hypothetical protein